MAIVEHGKSAVGIRNDVNALGASQFVVYGATPGVDAYALVAAQVALCKTAGGGTVVLPFIGGAGYNISQTIVVDFDNCAIELGDHVTLTKTDATNLVGPDATNQTGVNGVGICCFMFTGRITGTGAKTYIQRPRIYGTRRVIVNSQAQNTTGFTYVLGQVGNHAPIVFIGTQNGSVENIICSNGLTGGIIASYSPWFVADRCVASTTIYDNGICALVNQEHLVAVSDSDPTTWANTIIRDCVAINCANHGIGSYGAIGVTVENPLVIGCGNNTGIAVSGPAGGINFEHDGTNLSRDYRGTVINPRVFNSFGFGMRTNCKGTRAIGGCIAITKLPTAYSANPSYNLWGSAIFVQGAGELVLEGTDIEGSEAYGIRLAVAGGLYPSVYIRGGKYTGCTKRAIFGQGVATVTMSPDTLITGNGNVSDTTAGDQYCIDISNSADNTDAGLFQIAGRFENNKGGICKLSRPGTVDWTKGISGKGNGGAWASAYFMLFITDSVQTLHAANISLDNQNGKAARLAQVAVAVRAFVDRRSIIGEQTSTTREPFEVVVVSNSIRGNGPDNVIFPSYVASYTPDSARGDITFSSLTGNMTVNANSTAVAPIDGQTLTFIFIQDATGGRSITWNAGWKGATLTGAGTSSQRAVVTFRFSATQWVQMSSTGWFS